MPPFRGAVSLEEAWALARYLRTLVPGTETPRPDLSKPASAAVLPEAAELQRVKNPN
jgi:mono/diheme cytochrome c family protein